MAPEPRSPRPGPRTALVDTVVAALIFALGAVVVWDSYRLGARWAADGPQSGYFPFYVGLLICISSAVIVVQSLARVKTDRHRFVEAAQLRQVMVIFLPAAAFVLGVQYIGIYVSAALFIGLFMRFVGRYPVLRSVAAGPAVSLVAFTLFEIWFQIPLPKGPVENLLGY
ncbi:MAG: tripartite tricarboxylate transporter TctB family protein [Burkholderiales bacterium]|nr:tripartite tricarboxylate transporter TctB family protein [Burkholderiales bacterium]